MIYDDLATRLASEYGLFLLALTGRYQQIRAPGVEVTPRVIADLQFDGYKLGNTFYEIAEREIDNYLRPMLEAASGDAIDALLTRKNETLTAIRFISIENVQTVAKLARTGISGIASMLAGSTGSIGLLVQRQVGKIDFKAHTRSGREWDAKKLLRSGVRDFGYQSWLDATAQQFRESGMDIMQSSKGDVFSLAGTEGYPTFDEVRETAFHFNSTAIMVPYVPS